MKRIIVDNGIFYTKIAAADEREVFDFCMHENLNKSIVGSVYRGKICRILPGLRAAFVDIGRDKKGYLPISTKDALKQGSEVMVQVQKDEMGDKGAKISLEISIAGKHVIFLPQRKSIKISNKIRIEEERQRLQSISKEICNDEFAVIVRTNAQGIQKAALESEIECLKREWEKIKKESLLGIGPKLLHETMDPVLEYIRDYCDDSFEEVVLNRKEDLEKVEKMLRSYGMDSVEAKLFVQTSDVFDYYKIKSKIKSLSRKKIWLESGAHIIIEKTEAMTVVDVNTGKSVKGFDVESKIQKTNMEAADEISRQIKLRDIGGIVIVDFIDMKKFSSRQKLVERLEALFADEPGGTFVHGITKLGLVEITRKNRKRGIGMLQRSDCPACKGTGHVKPDYMIMDFIEKEALRAKMHTSALVLSFDVSPDFYDRVKENGFNEVRLVCSEYGLGIVLLRKCDLSPGSIKVGVMGSRDYVVDAAAKEGEYSEIYPLTKHT